VNQNYSRVLNYIGQRASYVRGQLPAQVPFAIATNGGQDFLVNSNSTVLSGTAWLNVRRILLEGHPDLAPFNWPTLSSWQTSVPLILGTNRFHFLAYDFQGNPAGSTAIIVTSTDIHAGVDTDHDGMPDLWEEAVGLSPFSNDADADSDGDGLSNLQEYLAGTNPFDASSYLKIQAAKSTNGLHVTFRAVAGRSYTVQYRDALASGQWNQLTNIAPQVGDHTVAIPDALPPGVGARFFRVTVSPAPH